MPRLCTLSAYPAGLMCRSAPLPMPDGEARARVEGHTGTPQCVGAPPPDAAFRPCRVPYGAWCMHDAHASCCSPPALAWPLTQTPRHWQSRPKVGAAEGGRGQVEGRLGAAQHAKYLGMRGRGVRAAAEVVVVVVVMVRGWVLRAWVHVHWIILDTACTVYMQSGWGRGDVAFRNETY